MKLQENQKKENNLETTEVNPSTEQESETLTEENIENFPIIEVESEENQQDECDGGKVCPTESYAEDG